MSSRSAATRENEPKLSSSIVIAVVSTFIVGVSFVPVILKLTSVVVVAPNSSVTVTVVVTISLTPFSKCWYTSSLAFKLYDPVFASILNPANSVALYVNTAS